MILDTVQPMWDSRRTESRLLFASSEAIYRAALNVDFLDVARLNPWVKLLFSIRSFFEFVACKYARKAVVPVTVPAMMKLSGLPTHGEWVRLGEQLPNKFAFGAIGRFWAGQTVWTTIDFADFVGFKTPGHAKIACHFLIESAPGGAHRLLYETRTLATDPASSRDCLRYLRFVSPFVGFIMRATLSLIERAILEEQLRDPLLDQFMPKFDVAERRSIRILAPAGTVLDSAHEMDLMGSGITRFIFRARELIKGSTTPTNDLPSGLIAATSALGWGILAEAHGREIVMGAITQPWAADVKFRSIPSEKFALHKEPDHVKIAWTLRAIPLSDSTSLFVTETRVAACDEGARRKFKRYWLLFSAGIILIRLALLRFLKRDAERIALGDRSI